MRIAISNLAWPSAQDDFVFARLHQLGVAGVEVAPTRLAPWDHLPNTRLIDYRARVEAAGLVVSSLQAVLFGRPDLQLLGDRPVFDLLVAHMREVGRIGAVLGATVLVFGSPKNRLLGAMAPAAGSNLARERFYELGEALSDHGVTLGIEPVPPVYGGDFLTSWQDVAGMVRDTGHPSVRVHLDTGCVALGGGAIDAAILETGALLAHFHAAQPQLGDFTDPLPGHGLASAALTRAGYKGWVSIEMREQPDDPLRAVEAAIRTVRAIYGAPSSGCG